MFKKILIVCAHPDDELIGCGGLILNNLKKTKFKIIYTCKTYDKRNKKVKSKFVLRKRKAVELSKQLNIETPIFFNFPGLSLQRKDITSMSQLLLNEIKKFKPDSIFTHCIEDLHHDHRATSESVMIATRPSSHNTSVKNLFYFEIPSATEKLIKKNKVFNPNFFIDISDSINLKVNLIKKYYSEELKKYPAALSVKGIINLSKYRGNNIRRKNVEAFEIIKLIM